MARGAIQSIYLYTYARRRRGNEDSSWCKGCDSSWSLATHLKLGRFCRMKCHLSLIVTFPSVPHLQAVCGCKNPWFQFRWGTGILTKVKKVWFSTLIWKRLQRYAASHHRVVPVMNFIPPTTPQDIHTFFLFFGFTALSCFSSGWLRKHSVGCKAHIQKKKKIDSVSGIWSPGKNKVNKGKQERKKYRKYNAG